MTQDQLAMSQNILPKVMNFEMGHVTQRYAADNNVSWNTAKEHEKELKRFLTLCILFPETSFAMESKPVDQLWHTFIWHTPDYFAFCNDIAGKYIHHQPTPEDYQSAQSFSIVELYYELFGENPPAQLWDINRSSNKVHACSRSGACRSAIAA